MQPNVFNTTKQSLLPLGTHRVSYGAGCTVFRVENNDAKSDVRDCGMGKNSVHLL